MDQMFSAFNEAFSTYEVNMQLSRSAFDKRMLNKIHIDFGCSVGAFEGERLVGFIFHSTGHYEGSLAVYNGGTGIIPSHRGYSLVKRMYDFIRNILLEKGVEKCVLEVLQSNEKAQSSYAHSGFSISKDFQCMVLPALDLKKTVTAFEVSVAQTYNMEEYRSIATIEMNMLDQLESIQHNWPYEMALEVRENNLLLGFLIFQPHNGRLSQLAVAKDQRGRGISRLLISFAFQKSEVPKLSVLNINNECKGLIQFFEHLGFEKDLTQYEMQWNL